MLTSHLQKSLNDKWDNCWPVSNLRPSALLDLICYIFFIKKADDRELLNKNIQVKQADNFIYTKDVEEFNWSNFKNMDAQSIYDLFTKEHGILDLMIQYGHSNSLYSDFFKAPLVLSPTPKLLFNVIEIINLVETSDKNTQADIAEYLFDKARVSEQNSVEYIPEYLSRLIVCIAEPVAKDLIWDPAAANCSLLINAEKYIATRKTEPAKSFEKSAAGGNGNLLIKADGSITDRSYSTASGIENDMPAAKLKGVESDLIQLRLGAMNMILHGIKNPSLESLVEKSLRNSDSPTLIISNLLFPGVESELMPRDVMSQSANFGKEIVLLNSILTNMKPGCRAAIMVPEILLKSITPEIKKIRQQIIETYNLEGVITLPQKNESIFSGAGVLIFNKHSSIVTNNVWFCKMEKNKERNYEDEQSLNDNQNELFLSAEISNIINKWKNRRDTQTNTAGNSFNISAYDIKMNNYNLNFNDYKVIHKSDEENKKAQNVFTDKKNTLVATKKEHLHHFFEDSVPIEHKKRKRKILPGIIILLILITAAGMYFYNFKTNTFSFFNTNKTPDSVSDINIQSANQQQAGTAESNKSATRKGLPTSSITSKRYSVIAKAYFYSEPDETKQRSLFLQARKDLILTPTNEKNGFVYVVYINKKGEATKGWLNKKDLQPVE
jgi:type I restriction enzyme M protein